MDSFSYEALYFADMRHYSNGVKPPIGLLPKFIHAEKRFIDIREAISRYTNEGLQIPSEWIYEYNELAKYIQERKNNLRTHP